GRDAAKNNRIAGDGADVVVGDVVVAHGHRVGLDPRRDVEIGVGDDARLAAGLNQKARMAEPFDEVAAELGRRAPAARLSQRALFVEELDQRGIAERLHQPPRQQKQEGGEAEKRPAPHRSSLMISAANASTSVSFRFQASLARPALTHVWLRNIFISQPYSTATWGSRTPRRSWP